MWGYFAFSHLLGMEMEDLVHTALAPVTLGLAQVCSSDA